jgi:quercetin dioxygenase-like cupin family protein
VLTRSPIGLKERGRGKHDSGDQSKPDGTNASGESPPSITSIHVAPDEGEKIPSGPRYHRVLAELPELEVIDARFGPGFSVDAHSHPDHVDSFYVLEGEAEFTLGEDVVRAGPGTWVAVSVGMLHCFRNVGDGELRILNIHAPNGGFADWLRAKS